LEFFAGGKGRRPHREKGGGPGPGEKGHHPFGKKKKSRSVGGTKKAHIRAEKREDVGENVKAPEGDDLLFRRGGKKKDENKGRMDSGLWTKHRGGKRKSKQKNAVPALRGREGKGAPSKKEKCRKEENSCIPFKKKKKGARGGLGIPTITNCRKRGRVRSERKKKKKKAVRKKFQGPLPDV